MNFKTTYILFGLLGGVLLVFVVAVWLSPLKPLDTTYVFPSAHDESNKIDPKDIDAVAIERDRPRQEKLVFTRTGKDAWKMEHPGSYRIESSRVDDLVRHVLDAKKQKGVEVDRNLERWGLKNPSATITLKGKGRTFELFIGKEYSNRVYALSSDERKEPMVVLRSGIEEVFKPANDFRARDLLASNPGNIEFLKLQHGPGEPRILEQRSGQWWFVKPDYGPADYEGASTADANKPPTGVSTLLSAMTDIRVDSKTPPPAEDLPGDKKDKEKKDKEKQEIKADSGFVEDNAKDLKKYNLETEKSADLVIEVKRTAEGAQKAEAVTLLVGKKVDKEEQYYARLASDRNVVKVSAKALEPLRKFIANPEELRDHDLVREKPDVVRIKYRSGEEIELIKTGMASAPRPGPHSFGDTWKLYRGNDKKGLITDTATVTSLVSALTAKRQVKEFPTGQSDKALGLDSPNVVVSLWANGIKKGEKKKDENKKDAKKDKDGTPKVKDKDGDRPELRSDTPDVVLEFGATDSDNRVAVRRKMGKDLKDTLVVKVDASVFTLANGDALSYLQKNLPPLIPSSELLAVARVTLELDGKVTELVHKDPKDKNSPWVFDKPSDLKGRKADTEAVNNLFTTVNDLRIVRWKSLKATDPELSRWGLKSPTNRVTFTPEGSDKKLEKSLLIGNPIDDKKTVYYARQSDRDSIFLVSKAEVDKLKTPLLDLTVFDFKAGDVKAVKLSGWPRRGKPDVLELERKGANSWEGKDREGKVTVNAGRAEALIAALEQLKAEKFLALKGGARAAHGMDVKKGAVEIEVSLANKDKITLTIGNRDGDSFYATSSKHPGAVFLIKAPGSIFEELKKEKGSEYLTTS